MLQNKNLNQLRFSDYSDDLREDFLRPPNGTTQAAVK